MGNETSSASVEGAYGYKVKPASSLPSLIQDIDALNNTSKTSLYCKEFFLCFELESKKALQEAGVQVFANWQKSVRILIKKVKRAKNAAADAESVWRVIDFTTFYKIYAKMQSEASIHCMNEKIAKKATSATPGTPTDEDDEDCVICMDRKAEIALPCTHSFCQQCIEQWNLNSATCPTCRRAVNVHSEDDSNSSFLFVSAPVSQEEVANNVYKFVEQATPTNVKLQYMKVGKQQHSPTRGPYEQFGSHVAGANLLQLPVLEVSVIFPKPFNHEPIVHAIGHSHDERDDSFLVNVSSTSKTGFTAAIKRVSGTMLKKDWSQSQLRIDWIARLRDEEENSRTIIGKNSNPSAASIKVTIPICESTMQNIQLLKEAPIILTTVHAATSSEGCLYSANVEKLYSDRFDVRIRKVSQQSTHEWNDIISLNWSIYPTTGIIFANRKFGVVRISNINTQETTADSTFIDAQFSNHDGTPVSMLLSPIHSSQNLVTTVHKTTSKTFRFCIRKLYGEEGTIGNLDVFYIACTK